MTRESPLRKVPRTIGEFLRATWAEIARQRRWLLIPLWLLLALIAVVFVLTGNPRLLPAIYIAF